MGLGGGQFLLLLAEPQGASLFLLGAILIGLSLAPLALMCSNMPDFPDIQPVRLCPTLGEAGSVSGDFARIE